MAEMVGGVVETVGEEPEPESEDLPEQHEEEEEELTKVSHRYDVCAQNLVRNDLKASLLLAGTDKIHATIRINK